MLRLAINGASGRMGRRLIALAAEQPQFKLVAATASPTSSHLGQDAGTLAGIGSIDLPITGQLSGPPHVVIDFSTRLGTQAALNYCELNGIPLVIATTNLGSALQERIAAASQKFPICQAPSMGLAVNLTMKLVEQAAKTLRHNETQVDVEIIERHHRFKTDAPSGTALKFGEIIAKTMGQSDQRHGRLGDTGTRQKTEIGFHAIRAGDDPGQHTILFGMMGETIEIKVAASNRDCYARGALLAANYLANAQPGLFSMHDVLGL